MIEETATGKERYFERVPKAFNEWMRRYTEEPERFEHEMRTTTTFIRERSQGVEPTYGEVCAAYLDKIIGELFPAGATT